MKKYTLNITVGYFNHASKTEEEFVKGFKDAIKEVYGKFNVSNVIAETVEFSEGHISGTMTIPLEVENDSKIVKVVAKFVQENSLIGECFSLRDENEIELFTEEEIE